MKRNGKTLCCDEGCPIEVSIEVVGGMWKTLIIRELIKGTQRYSELHRALAPVTHKMLAQQLRDLENDGVVLRKVYPQVPPKVEYSLSPLGLELIPMMDALRTWGRRVLDHRSKMKAAEKESA